MSKRDQEYYLSRVAAELEAAKRATSEAARSAHLQLADQYQQMVDGHRRQEPPKED
jgi:hypothetical protein